MRKTFMILILLIVRNSNGQVKLQFENEITLEVYISEFDSRNHKIDSCRNGQGFYYCNIDDSPWFGCDKGLELPIYQLDSLIFSNANVHVRLEVSSMYNPTFSGTIDKRHFEIINYMDENVLSGWFSDGAGTYCSRWVIRNGKQIRTLLSTDEEECFN